MRRRDFLRMLAATSLAPVSPLAADRVLDVVVVGGGIAGLCAAHELADLDLLLFEAEPQPGGRAVDRRHQGWSYPLGAVYLGRPYGVLARLIRRLGLHPIEIARPTDAVFDGQRLFVGEADLLRQLVAEDGVAPYNRFVRTVRQAYREYEDLPDYRPRGRLAGLDRITAREWLRQMDLPPGFMGRMEVAVRGLFGTGLDEISALGTLSELAFDYADSDLLDEPSDVNEIAREVATEGSGAYTLRGGLSAVTRGLADSLGPRLRGGTPVRQVRRDGAGFRVQFAAGEVRCRGLILATPAPVTLEIAGDLLEPAQRVELEFIAYAPVVSAAVFSRDPLFDQAFDLALPPDWSFTDLYDGTWVQRHNLGETGEGAVLGIHAPPRPGRGRSLVSLSDRELVDLFGADLERLVPGARHRITGHRVQRHPYGFPVMPPGAFARLGGLHASLEDSPLQLAGDYLIYPTFEAAADSGELAAERLRESL